MRGRRGRPRGARGTRPGCRWPCLPAAPAPVRPLPARPRSRHRPGGPRWVSCASGTCSSTSRGSAALSPASTTSPGAARATRSSSATGPSSSRTTTTSGGPWTELLDRRLGSDRRRSDHWTCAPWGVRTTRQIAQSLVAPDGQPNHSIPAHPRDRPARRRPVGACLCPGCLARCRRGQPSHPGHRRCRDARSAGRGGGHRPADSGSDRLRSGLALPAVGVRAAVFELGPASRCLCAVRCRLDGGGVHGHVWAVPPAAQSFRSALRHIGVLGGKHIPSAYLRASIEQRRALLAGLLDTDGTVRAHGTVHFDTTTEPACPGRARTGVVLGLPGNHDGHGVAAAGDRPRPRLPGRFPVPGVTLPPYPQERCPHAAVRFRHPDAGLAAGHHPRATDRLRPGAVHHRRLAFTAVPGRHERSSPPTTPPWRMPCLARSPSTGGRCGCWTPNGSSSSTSAPGPTSRSSPGPSRSRSPWSVACGS